MGELWVPPGVVAPGMADLDSHRIEGFAHQGGARIDVPLVSQIDETLFMGGCLNGVPLPDHFRFVVSLYPFEAYSYGTELQSALVVRLFDSTEIPEPRLLEAIADWVNTARRLGPTLVHCQAGLNRSGLVCALALMRGDGLSAADAISVLRSKRAPVVLCNPAFEAWLLEHDDETPSVLSASTSTGPAIGGLS